MCPPASRWRPCDEARLPDRLHARAAAGGDRRLGGGQRLRGARARRLAAAGRPPVHGQPPGRRPLRRGRGRACARDAAPARADALGAGLLRQQPAPRSGRARGDPRPPAVVRRRVRGARRAAGRHLHRPRPGPQRCREPARGRARPAAPGRLRARARRHVDGRELRDGGLDRRRRARQPRLLARTVGVDVRPRLRAELRPLAPAVAGHRSGRGAQALRRARRPRARQGRRDLRRPAQSLWVLRADGDARGRPVGHGLVALPDPGPGRRRLPSLRRHALRRRLRRRAERRARGPGLGRHAGEGAAGPADRPPQPAPAGGGGMSEAPVLDVRGLVKEYPGVRALQGVDLDVRTAEVHCLLGPNGAGKSTLIKCVSGAVEPTAGQILFEGEPLPSGDPAGSLKRGVATIYQELDLVEDLTVAESIFLAHEPRRGPLLDRDRMVRDSAALLARLGHEAISPRTKIRALRPAAQQIVSIARALSGDVRLLIMDEPSAILDEGEIQTLFDVVRRLTTEGVGVIYITHRLDEIRRIGDRVTVLADGRTAATGLPATTPTDELVTLMVGRRVEQLYPERPIATGDVLLDVRAMRRLPEVRGVSLQVHAGEIVGLGGLVGSGRTELLGLIYGIDRPDEGEVWVDA